MGKVSRGAGWVCNPSARRRAPGRIGPWRTLFAQPSNACSIFQKPQRTKQGVGLHAELSGMALFVDLAGEPILLYHSLMSRPAASPGGTI